MKNVQVDYYSPANVSVVTETGFRYLNVNPIVVSQSTIIAANEIEVFEIFYGMNNKLRYCNGSYYKFVDNDWDTMYKEWLKSDDYKQKSFQLYYGNGIVD